MIDKAEAGTGEVTLPEGTFTIARAGTSAYGLKISGRVHLRGAGQGKTILRQAPGTPPSVRLLQVSGDGVVIEDLTLDGNKAAQTPDAQRHGLFALETRQLVVRNVTAQNFTGDGLYLYQHADGTLFSHVVATHNDRNGITLGGMLDGTQVVSSKLVANKAQQLDSEPGGTNVVSNTRVTDSDLDGAGASNDYALTCSGTGPNSMGQGWTVTGNRIHGGIFVVWAEHVVIADNVGTNPTTKPSVSVYRSAADVAIRGNRFKQTATGGAPTVGVLIQGTQASGPRHVVVAGNTIEVASENSFGVRAAGAHSVEIVDNVLRGPGRRAPGFAGIQLRATNPAFDFDSALVRGNRISNFGARGIIVAGNGAAKLLSVEIRDNTFIDDSAVPSMTEAISLDDGSGAARQIAVIGNKCVGGVKAELTNVPANVPVLVGGVRGAGATYNVAQSPEGAVAETPGATAVRHNPDGTATYYRKRSGKHSKTGWVPVAAP